LQQQVFAAFCALAAKPGVEAPELIQHVLANEKGAAVADQIGVEVAMENPAAHAVLVRRADDVPGGVDHPERGIDERSLRPAGQERGELLRGLGGMPQVIRIDEGDELACAGADSRVASRRHAAIRLRDHAESPVAHAVLPHQRRGIVAGAVVNHDHFEIAIGLLRDRLQRLLDGRTCVERRHHHRNGGTTVHHSSYPMHIGRRRTQYQE
jgi:hypothetical protein